MTIREFYVAKYPTDDMGDGINPTATFAGLLNQLIIGGDVYEYLNVYDSIIRERLFEGLAEELNVKYEYVYNLWLNN
jgi:hypothetical protein